MPLRETTAITLSFGGSVEEGCVAVHPSDTAPALIALDASIRTSKRTIKAEDFFQVGRVEDDSA